MNDSEACSKEMKDMGSFVTAVSAFAVCVGLLMGGNPMMGEFRRLGYTSSWVAIFLGSWGVITGIGILRKWRWARISMLVFCGILVIIGGSIFLVMLLTPLRDPRGWTRELVFGKILVSAILLVPPLVGVRWCMYFTRKDAKAYFRPKANCLK